MSEITPYLIKHFPNLNLIPPPDCREADLSIKDTEIVYYLLSEIDDKIHIVIPSDIYLNQIREGTFIKAVELLTFKGK